MSNIDLDKMLAKIKKVYSEKKLQIDKHNKRHLHIKQQKNHVIKNKKDCNRDRD